MFAKVIKDLYAVENWKNKAVEEMPMRTLEIIVSNRKAVKQKILRKRSLKIKDKKPSKFCRKCPNIMLTQDAAVAAVKVSIENPLFRSMEIYLWHQLLAINENIW